MSIRRSLAITLLLAASAAQAKNNGSFDTSKTPALARKCSARATHSCARHSGCSIGYRLAIAEA
jgi:hypothetical protein